MCLGESTRGHNRVANTLLCLASLADGSSCAEPHGLIASRPALRPADVLTTAAFGRGAALDVSIVCPDATGAGSDPCVASVTKKMQKYGEVLDELLEAGYHYTGQLRGLAGGGPTRRLPPSSSL